MKFIINSNEDIQKAIALIEKMFPDIPCKEYPKNYVFNENKSVKWNREEVIRINRELCEDRATKRRLKTLAYTILDTNIISYIQESFKLSEKIAETVLAETKKQKDDNDWADYIDDYAKFAATIITLYNSK